MPGPQPLIWCSAEFLFASRMSRSEKQCSFAWKGIASCRICRLEDLQTLNPAFDQDFYACLNLQSVLAIHDVPGGTAPARVRQAISDARAEARLHARGSPCTRVKPFCPMLSEFTN